MNPSLFRFVKLWLVLFLVLLGPKPVRPAEPRVQILSPTSDARITQDQSTILVSGKVASQNARSSNVDITLVIDISGSTIQYAGVDLGDAGQLPDGAASSGFPRPQISIGGLSLGQPPMRNLRNSILAAEVAAARRLLLQLNA